MSQQRKAHIGLILSCLTLAASLTVLVVKGSASQSVASSQARIAAGAPAVMDLSMHR